MSYVTYFLQITQCLDDNGPQTVPQIVDMTGIPHDTVRTSLAKLRMRGYVQSYKEPKKLTRYAATTKEYTGTRETYRTPCAVFAADGCVWIFPSIGRLAKFYGMAHSHVWGCIHNNWKVRGQRVELI